MSDKKQLIKKVIRHLIKEEFKKRDAFKQRAPQANANGLPEYNKDDGKKKFSSQVLIPDEKSVEKIVQELDAIVKSVDKNYCACLNDHRDISIIIPNHIQFRINPKWNGSYDVEVMVKNVDRIFVVGLTSFQLKDFVQKNLENNADTTVEQLMRKVDDNRKDKDNKGQSKATVKEKKVSSSQNKEKSYVETATEANEMEEVKDIKKQKDHKVQTPVKLRKKVSNNTLIKKLKS